MGHLPEVTSTSVNDHIDLISSDPSVLTSSNQGKEFSQLSKLQLIMEHENVPELNCLIQRATTDSEIDQVPTCYYLRNGILMRKWRLPEISVDIWVLGMTLNCIHLLPCKCTFLRKGLAHRR